MRQLLANSPSRAKQLMPLEMERPCHAVALTTVPPGHMQKELTGRIKAIAKTLVPVIQSNLRKDYKLLDEVLVTKIPFILTCQVQPYMAMAFDDGRLALALGVIQELAKTRQVLLFTCQSREGRMLNEREASHV